MAEYLLQVYHGGRTYEPPVEGGVSWETSRKGAPGKLQFTVLDSGLPVEEGDTVTFSAGGKGLFYGFVFTLSRNGADGRLSVTAYDQLRYLKNKDNYIYSNKTAGELLKMIAEDFSLKTGAIAATGYNIPYRVEDGKTLFDIIETALDLTYENTGREFVLYDDFGKLSLAAIEELETNLLIDETAAEGFSYESSIDRETYNKIKLLHEDGRKNLRQIFLKEDRESQKKWGVLQNFSHVSGDEDGYRKAQTLLNEHDKKSKTLTLSKIVGDVRVRAGSGLWVKLDLKSEQVDRKMVAQTVKHSFSDGEHRMDLSLKGGAFDG